MAESRFCPVTYESGTHHHKFGIFRVGRCGNNFGLKRSKCWVGYFCLLDYELENQIDSSVFIEIVDKYNVPLASSFERKFTYNGGFAKQAFIPNALVDRKTHFTVNCWIKPVGSKDFELQALSCLETMEHLLFEGKHCHIINIIIFLKNKPRPLVQGILRKGPKHETFVPN